MDALREMVNNETALAVALKVIVLTPHIRSYLLEHDPKALDQAEAALRRLPHECLFPAHHLPFHRADQHFMVRFINKDEWEFLTEGQIIGRGGSFIHSSQFDFWHEE